MKLKTHYAITSLLLLACIIAAIITLTCSPVTVIANYMTQEEKDHYWQTEFGPYVIDQLRIYEEVGE